MRIRLLIRNYDGVRLFLISLRVAEFPRKGQQPPIYAFLVFLYIYSIVDFYITHGQRFAAEHVPRSSIRFKVGDKVLLGGMDFSGVA